MGAGLSKVVQYRACRRLRQDRISLLRVRAGVERVDRSEERERGSTCGGREGINLPTLGVSLSTIDSLLGCSSRFSRVVVKGRKEKENRMFWLLPTPRNSHLTSSNTISYPIRHLSGPLTTRSTLMGTRFSLLLNFISRPLGLLNNSIKEHRRWIIEL